MLCVRLGRDGGGWSSIVAQQCLPSAGFTNTKTMGRVVRMSQGVRHLMRAGFVTPKP